MPRCGSSPRVRGKRIFHWPVLCRPGLIPACAGKTRSCTLAFSTWTAHPRVCGENEILTAEDLNSQGSSPRVRGKHAAFATEIPYGRLIPACAGKTKSLRSASALRRAHPRVCGENAAFKALDALDEGSSPRVRGKLASDGSHYIRHRLIPACAGKTQARGVEKCSVWAHPRVCGENHPSQGGRARRWGSSPRVRGKLGKRRLNVLGEGLIPACAGKTQSLIGRR